MAEPCNEPTQTAPSSIRRVARTAVPLALVAVTALAFGWPTRFGDFLSGDDQRFVTEHVFVNHPSLRHAARLVTVAHGDLYQPVPMLSFQANYATAARDPGSRFAVSPYGFHLTNIILHAVNALLVSLVVQRLARSRRVAFLTAIMFACHPLALEAVAWISGRMILMATLFSLLLLLVCVSRRPDGRGARAWLGSLSWLLALLSKVLISVPIAAMLCDRHAHGRLPRRCWIIHAGWLGAAIAAAGLGLVLTANFGMIERTGAETTTAAPVRVLLAGRGYLENYVWPDRIAAWSPPARGIASTSPPALIAVLEWLLFGGLMMIARRYNRLAWLGLALFAVLIAPFLGATLARRISTADRYMYLPIVGLHMALAAVAVQAWDGLRKRIRSRAVLGLTVLPCIAVPAAWIVTSWTYADGWKDTISRDRRIVQVYPDRVEAHAELARAYLFQHEPDAALAVVAEAERHWPGNVRLASLAGEAYRLKGDWHKAAERLARAAELMPHHSRTHYYLGLTLQRLGQVDRAQECLRRLLDWDPAFLPAVTALARSYRDGGRTDAAARMFERAIEINPFHRDSLFELSLLYLRSQDYARAAILLGQLIDIDPCDAPALLNLGVTLTRIGRQTEALAVYDRLAELDTHAAAPRLNRAALLADMGQLGVAEREYRALLAADPACRDAAIGLHELLQSQGRFGDLVALWSQEARGGLDPDEANAWLAWAHALAGDADSARRVATAVSDAVPARAFADWALAYAALRTGDENAVLRILASPKSPAEVSVARRERARIILTALAALPPQTRDSPACRYALARAMLFDGNVAAARSVAREITVNAPGPAWEHAARAILHILDDAQDRPPDDPPQAPSP